MEELGGAEGARGGSVGGMGCGGSEVRRVGRMGVGKFRGAEGWKNGRAEVWGVRKSVEEWGCGVWGGAGGRNGRVPEFREGADVCNGRVRRFARVRKGRGIGDSGIWGKGGVRTGERRREKRGEGGRRERVGPKP